MSYTAGSYSPSQQVYAFNQIINAGFGVTEYNSLPDLQGFVDTVISQTMQDPSFAQYMGNDWQTLWGPVVFSNNPGANSVVADNTMALFYSPAQNLYVIAIAGTNIDSAYGWMKEDFNVKDTVPWSAVVGNGFTIPSVSPQAAISAGSNLGLQALLGMRWKSQSMIDALTASLNTLAAGSQVHLAVSGHSLGGALSPVMALYLHDLQLTTANWNTNGYVVKINAAPTAGPTPGEANWAAYYSYQCGQTPAAGQAGIAYISLYNTLDVVPHAWMPSDIAVIPTIYRSNIGSIVSHGYETITGSLATGAYLNGCNTTRQFLGHTVPDNTYTQVSAAPAVRQALTGTFNSTLDKEITSKTTGLRFILPSGMGDYAASFVDFVRFVAQLGYQHTVAYSGDTSTTPYTDGLLQVVDVVALEQYYKKKNLPSQQSETDLHMAALSRATGVDLGSLDTSGMDAGEQSSGGN